jgi:hypothetical protein
MYVLQYVIVYERKEFHGGYTDDLNTLENLCKGGHANFFVSPQIANPQILEIIPQSQARKFLRCAMVHKSQIRKFVMINPQIAFPQISLGPTPHEYRIRKFERKSVSDLDPHRFNSNIFLPT